jgi:hypothetical protein
MQLTFGSVQELKIFTITTIVNPEIMQSHISEQYYS